MQDFSFREQHGLLKVQFFACELLSTLTLRSRHSSNILPSTKGEIHEAWMGCADDRAGHGINNG